MPKAIYSMQEGHKRESTEGKEVKQKENTPSIKRPSPTK